jgi:hypothetical protein
LVHQQRRNSKLRSFINYFKLTEKLLDEYHSRKHFCVYIEAVWLVAESYPVDDKRVQSKEAAT